MDNVPARGGLFVGRAVFNCKILIHYWNTNTSSQIEQYFGVHKYGLPIGQPILRHPRFRMCQGKEGNLLELHYFQALLLPAQK
jgi:hypothetical protein